MKLAFKHTIAAIILVLSAAPVTAGPLEDAIAARDRGDYATALRLFQPLADNGDAIAQLILGDMYRTGRGVPKNDAEAVVWYRKAADQGYARAQLNLGFMYANGLGVPKDFGECMKWYRLAADQGYAHAQYNLGLMYANAQGVPQDPVMAYMWFNLSAAQGYQNAAKDRDLVVPLMTPQQIAEALKLAREWKPTTHPPR
jgi:TPR repeat protein